MERELRYVPHLEDDRSQLQYDKAPLPLAEGVEANVVTSLIGEVDGVAMHAPVIDVDMPCRAVESRTPGHFHLYVDKVMTWTQYKALLYGMMMAGVIEEGYYFAAMAQRMTCVRRPAESPAKRFYRMTPEQQAVYFEWPQLPAELADDVTEERRAASRRPPHTPNESCDCVDWDES